MNSRHFVITALALVMGASAAGGALADTPWQARHPGREEVNARLHRQDMRIMRERRAGEITPGEAYSLHRDDQRIRLKERRFAEDHRGRLTRTEWRRLNHQENHVSRRIGA
ncbi:MAG TPA: hypothetical protein VGS12_16725 [Caulobacteraceae bacterium]|nr:hypothetical protein [Caulobacteraceae bacterium]